MRLVVDIDFQSQFELARPTASYKQLTDTLPTIYVGTEAKLIKIISLLCSAAKQSLKDRGLHLPPWRTTTYMQSKWLASSLKKDLNNADNEVKSIGVHCFSNWVPPIVKPKRRNLGNGSGLSSQFSNMRINCCQLINYFILFLASGLEFNVNIAGRVVPSFLATVSSFVCTSCWLYLRQFSRNEVKLMALQFPIIYFSSMFLFFFLKDFLLFSPSIICNKRKIDFNRLFGFIRSYSVESICFRRKN